MGGISVQRAGWLDRVVQLYKDRFVQDVRQLAPIQLQASIEQAPAGYTDSGEWDFSSVSRLLALLGASESAAPVRRALRRALRPTGPTRRFISKQQSWKLFPSLGRDHPNEIYYDFHYYDEYEESTEAPVEGAVEDEDEAVVVLRNPVEARLPSARISVKLLREILEARALAARKMPSTTRSTIPWIPMNKTEGNTTEESVTGQAATGGTGDDEQVTGDGGVTGGGDEGDGKGEGNDAPADAGDAGPTQDPAQDAGGTPAEGGDGADSSPKPDPDGGSDSPPGLRLRKKTVHKTVKKRSKPDKH